MHARNGRFFSYTRVCTRGKKHPRECGWEVRQPAIEAHQGGGLCAQIARRSAKEVW